MEVARKEMNKKGISWVPMYSVSRNSVSDTSLLACKPTEEFTQPQTDQLTQTRRLIITHYTDPQNTILHNLMPNTLNYYVIA